MNSSIVSSIIVSMRKVRLNRANPGQDNLFLRNRYFLYIEKWILTKKSGYIRHCTYFLATVLLLYFVEINRENVIFCPQVCDGAIFEKLCEGSDFYRIWKERGNWSQRKGDILNLQKSVGCIIHPLQENIYFGDAMLFWYFRGRNLALIMAGNLTVLCSMDLKGRRMVFASTARACEHCDFFGSTSRN